MSFNNGPGFVRSGFTLTAAAINEALEGEALVVDYIQTADRTGVVIPDNSYGQKDGVPYYGNLPFASSIFRKLNFQGVQALAMADGIQALHLGGFAIPAAEANDDAAPIALKIELQMDCVGGGAVPTTSNLYLLVRLGTGTVDLTQGSYIKITPGDMYEIRRMKGVVALAESAGLLRPNITLTSQEIARGLTPVTDADYFPVAEVDLTNDTTVTVTENVATSLQFYLVGNWAPADFTIVSVSGSIELLNETTVTGALA